MKFLLLLFVVSVSAAAEECPSNVEHFGDKLRIRDLPKGSWYVMYMIKMMNFMSIFNPENLSCMRMDLKVFDENQFSLTSECIDNSNQVFRLFIAYISKSKGVLISKNFYNQKSCNLYSKYRQSLQEIKVLFTDYKNHLLLYSCVNGSEGFMSLTRSLQSENGIYVYQLPKLEFFATRLFEMNVYVAYKCRNGCHKLSRSTENGNCTDYLKKSSFEDKAYNESKESVNSFSFKTYQSATKKQKSASRFVVKRAESDVGEVGKAIIFMIIVIIPFKVILVDCLFECM